MSDIDPSKLKVAELRDELKARGLDTKGTKAILVKRLRDALGAQGDSDPEETFDTTTEVTDTSTLDDSVVAQHVPEPEPEPAPVQAEPEPVPEAEPEPEPVQHYQEPEVTPAAPVEDTPAPEENAMEEAPAVASEPANEQTEAAAAESSENLEEEKAQQQYEQPPQMYEEPPQTYEQPPQTYEQPPQTYEQPPQTYEKPPQTYEQPPQMYEPQENAEQQGNGEAMGEQEDNKNNIEMMEQQQFENIQEHAGDAEIKQEGTDDVKQEDENGRRDDRDRRNRKREHSPGGRRRSRSRSNDRDRRRSRSPHRRDRHSRFDRNQPVKEMENDDWLQITDVLLDRYNSDLNLKINEGGLTAFPMSNDGFAFMWAGVRGTYGISSGKVCFEVKITENQRVDHLPDEETSRHVCRIGASLDATSTQLGEEPKSYGYGGTAKASENCKFNNFGETFGEGDVITCCIDMVSAPYTISYHKNGIDLGTAFNIDPTYLAGEALFPHVLTKNQAFEVNFGSREEPFFPVPEGYVFINAIPVEERVRGKTPPEKKEDCEMLMMCGLPGCGKTTWTEKTTQEFPEKNYTVLGTNSIIDKMKVMGLPRKRNYAGRWDVLIEKSTKCLNKMFEWACRKKRNYILDQTNVYPSAQRRKMRPFEGFQRKAIVIVPDDEEYKRRCQQREKVEGKEVPDSAILEMKANFGLPEVGALFDSVQYIEQQPEEAAKLVAQYNEEGKAACPPQEKRFRGDRFGGGERFGRGRGGGGGGGGRDRDRGFGGGRDRDRFGGGGGGFGGRDRDRGFGGGRDRDRFGGGGDRFGPPRERFGGGGGRRDGYRDRDRGFGGGRDRYSNGGERRDRGFGGKGYDRYDDYDRGHGHGGEWGHQGSGYGEGYNQGGHWGQQDSKSGSQDSQQQQWGAWGNQQQGGQGQWGQQGNWANQQAWNQYYQSQAQQQGYNQGQWANYQNYWQNYQQQNPQQYNQWYGQYQQQQQGANQSTPTSGSSTTPGK